MAGGGRTKSAKGVARCFAEIGSARKADTPTKVTLTEVNVVLGEVEWAAIQTLHVADSVAFEC